MSRALDLARAFWHGTVFSVGAGKISLHGDFSQNGLRFAAFAGMVRLVNIDWRYFGDGV
jgi:hypothetical protein